MVLGTVYLVGAGPGDPGLITVRGLRLLESADVVVFDRLVDERLLRNAKAEAEMIDVGKVPGNHRTLQDEINAILVDRANKVKSVVRLKGGDPFVFGRGGEEAEALHSAGVRFEVVPGITSPIAAPAYAGIPLTHRGHASLFTVVTGNELPGKEASAIAWDKLAQQGGTLVVLMGWENLAHIVETLIDNGKSLDTPVALVRWGTRPSQQTVTGTLENIFERAVEAKLSSPVVIVIGEVAALRDDLRWFDNRPLFGKRVLVTRTRTQAGVLAEELSQRGAEPIELPTIEIKPVEDFSRLDESLAGLNKYAWIIFTSVNAVKVVFERLDGLKLDSRAFHSAKIAAIGPATTESLREHGIVADLVPDRFVSEAILESFSGEDIQGRAILLPRADIARDVLNKGLAEMGADVDEIAVYRTVPPEASRKQAEAILEAGIDVATFTSSSTVKNLVDILDGDIAPLKSATIACIGPITAKTATDMGLRVDISATEHTIAGLVNAMEEHFAKEYNTSSGR